MIRALKLFANVWLSGLLILNLVGIVGQFFIVGFSGGIDYVQETYNPFNIIGWAVLFISASPALVAYWWRNTLLEKIKTTPH